MKKKTPKPDKKTNAKNHLDGKLNQLVDRFKKDSSKYFIFGRRHH